MRNLEWLLLEQVVYDEIEQSYNEGKDISVKSLKKEWEDISNLTDPELKNKRLNNLYNKTINTNIRDGYKYMEPSNYKEIVVDKQVLQNNLGTPLNSQKKLLDHIYGAWLGRCSGCLLGKPVEGMNYNRIKTLAEWKDNWPLNFYIRGKVGLPPEFDLRGEQFKRYHTGIFENVEEQNGMLRDDDIDYTLIGLIILEEKGFSFNSTDVGLTWLQRMPLLKTYTAERVAYKNLANNLKPPVTANFYNPYREWIGAQIRADIWGYVNPGKPEKASEFAYRDAVVSHQKNGIYGEMFISSMIAAAFYTENILNIINCGLAVIPRESRLYKAIKDVIRWYYKNPEWEQTLQQIIDNYGHYKWFHTIPNAAIVVMALLYGVGDFELSISISVMAGLDTDCNGATVGSILGARIGAENLPSKWIKPLNNRLSTAVFGMSDLFISDLAKRTFKIINNKKNNG